MVALALGRDFHVKDMPVAAAARLIGEHDTTPRQLLWHQLRSAGT